MGRSVIKKKVVYHKANSEVETRFEFITDSELREKKAKLRNEDGEASWHIYEEEIKLPFAQYLNERGVDYHIGQEIYSSARMFYRRIENPSGLLLIEAIALAKKLNITLDQLVKDFKKRSIL